MACTLWNWLGTGANPKLHLELSGNDAKWPPYNIDWGHSGNFAWNSGFQSASWNVKDEKGAWYGTITLGSDGVEVTWGKYDPGEGGHYLKGIHVLSYEGPGDHPYQLKVDEIHPTPTPSTGPFPNTPLATPAVYPDGKPIVLSVSGDKIVNNRGQTVLLKGLCRPSLEWNAQGEHLSPMDIHRLCHWGGGNTTCNVIRVSLAQDLWFSSPKKTDKDYQGSYRQIIDAIIHYSIKEKMAVILDLHKLVHNHDQEPMADSKSPDFWREVAAEYKDFGTVLFELFNEPYIKEHDQWLSGYQGLYDAVRATGAKNICIVGGLDYAYDLSFVNDKFHVKGDNIMYCSHPYYPKGYLRGIFEPTSNFAGVHNKFPVILTEFGVDGNHKELYDGPNKSLDEKGRQYYTEWLSYINWPQNRNGVHYTGWAWWVDKDNKEPWFPVLIWDWESGTAWNGGQLIHYDIGHFPPTPIDSH